MRLMPVAVVAAMFLAGCAAPPSSTCADEQCPAPSASIPMVTRPPDVPFPALPLNETLRTMLFENCTGFIGGIDVPYAVVRGETPPEFSPIGPPGFGRVILELYDCQRLALPDLILQDYRQLLVAIATRTVNESWEPVAGPSWIVLDLFVSSDGAVRALESWGFPATKAEFISEPLGMANAKEWTITAGSSVVRFNYPVTNNPQGNALPEQAATNYRWTGEDPFLRATVEKVYTLHEGDQEGIIEFDGPVNALRVTKTETQRVNGVEVLSVDARWTTDIPLFFGENT